MLSSPDRLERGEDGHPPSTRGMREAGRGTGNHQGGETGVGNLD